MGKVIDSLAKTKQMNDKYPLDRYYGVSALLYHLHQVREMRFTRGDFDASILLIDFFKSFKEANLTERQQQIIYYIFILDLTQYEVARMLGITQQAVSDHVNSVVKKVAAINRDKEDACA